jgi:Tol biopolymer transport system component
MNAKRRSQRRITLRGGGDPNCAPSSGRIAFVRNGDLYTIASDGTRLRRLTFKAASDIASWRAYSPTYSPDGREIAFLAEYNVPQQNGSEVALEVVDLRGHHVRPNRVIADTALSNGSYAAGGSAGIAWQPRVQVAPAGLPWTTPR